MGLGNISVKIDLFIKSLTDYEIKFVAGVFFLCVMMSPVCVTPISIFYCSFFTECNLVWISMSFILLFIITGVSLIVMISLYAEKCRRDQIEKNLFLLK